MENLTIEDKLSIALCYADYPILSVYIDALEYHDNLAEGKHYFKLGKRLLKTFMTLGFSIDNLKETLNIIS